MPNGTVNRILRGTRQEADLVLPSPWPEPTIPSALMLIPSESGVFDRSLGGLQPTLFNATIDTGTQWWGTPTITCNGNNNSFIRWDFHNTAAGNSAIASQSWTLEFPFSISALPTGTLYLAATNTGQAGTWGLVLNSTGALNISGFNSANGLVSANTQHLIGLAYDGVTGRLHLWLNGQYLGFGSSHAGSSTLGANQRYLWLGQNPSGTSSATTVRVGQARLNRSLYLPTGSNYTPRTIGFMADTRVVNRPNRVSATFFDSGNLYLPEFLILDLYLQSDSYSAEVNPARPVRWAVQSTSPTIQFYWQELQSANQFILWQALGGSEPGGAQGLLGFALNYYDATNSLLLNVPGLTAARSSDGANPPQTFSHALVSSFSRLDVVVSSVQNAGQGFGYCAAEKMAVRLA